MENDGLFSSHGLGTEIIAYYFYLIFIYLLILFMLLQDCRIDVFKKEVDAIRAFITMVGTIDPDILIGYEVQAEGLGYLIERATALGKNLLFSSS